MINIRLATIDDANAIAKVHVDSWKTTYKGLVEESVLDSLSYKNRKTLWDTVIGQGYEKSCVYVAENNGDIVGFVSAGPERTGKYGKIGELHAIYLLEDYHKQGIGKKLCSKVVEFLIQKNYQSMLVWVLAENPSRDFYLTLKPLEVVSDQVKMGERSYEEIAYAWDNLNNLAGLLRERING
ncbi:GNAT family N-acetyltransferase [Sutcliffiella deserti]|uniref:GNAT family N-acetyltransferase n=1 Tax=Sutcliffiella deserti TaxID=2875501 RepID=UPI001CC03D86|nr:GNAT family N-acetyltransferase [Sutcliffiella deserti]